MQLGKLDDARRSLSAVLRRVPSHSQSYHNLGVLEQWQNASLKRAAEYLDRSLALNPRSPYTHEQLAALEVQRRRLAELRGDVAAALFHTSEVGRHLKGAASVWHQHPKCCATLVRGKTPPGLQQAWENDICASVERDTLVYSFLF